MTSCKVLLVTVTDRVAVCNVLYCWNPRKLVSYVSSQTLNVTEMDVCENSKRVY